MSISEEEYRKAKAIVDAYEAQLQEVQAREVGRHIAETVQMLISKLPSTSESETIPYTFGADGHITHIHGVDVRPSRPASK